MINDLLGLAKIEAGKATVRLDKVSVAETCRTLVTLVRPMAEKKQLTVNLDLPDDLPLITTDGSKLQQILYNLLSNAIKFTPVNGEVTVAASVLAARSAGNGRSVAVAVIDTGPGISEADQKHIFDKFYQGDGSLTKESGGTGLGLAIAKELAVLLGGQISLASSPGAGATFTVTLAVEPPEPATNGGPTAAETSDDG